MKLCEKIRYLRNDIYNISQDKFAKMLNVSRSTIKNWETGYSVPNTNNLLLISILLNVSSDYLFYEDNPEELSLYNLTNDDYEVIKNIISYLERKNSHEK